MKHFCCLHHSQLKYSLIENHAGSIKKNISLPCFLSSLHKHVVCWEECNCSPCRYLSRLANHVAQVKMIYSCQKSDDSTRQMHRFNSSAQIEHRPLRSGLSMNVKNPRWHQCIMMQTKQYTILFPDGVQSGCIFMTNLVLSSCWVWNSWWNRCPKVLPNRRLPASLRKVGMTMPEADMLAIPNKPHTSRQPIIYILPQSEMPL